MGWTASSTKQPSDRDCAIRVGKVYFNRGASSLYLLKPEPFVTLLME
jgi:hypothetical protein